MSARAVCPCGWWLRGPQLAEITRLAERHRCRFADQPWQLLAASPALQVDLIDLEARLADPALYAVLAAAGAAADAVDAKALWAVLGLDDPEVLAAARTLLPGSTPVRVPALSRAA